MIDFYDDVIATVAMRERRIKIALIVLPELIRWDNTSIKANIKKAYEYADAILEVK